ncbi:hypothetical protein [Halocola ammonii]
MSEHYEPSQEQFEKIERYLSAELSEVERLAFESALKADPDLKSELDRQRELREVVEIGGMKSKLDEFHQKVASEHSKKSSGIRWWAIAAAFIGLIVASYFIFFNQTKSEKLFADYHTIDPGLPTPMSATDNYDFYDAMVDYKNEKYELSIEKWKPLLKENPDNDTLNFYIGSAHFANEKYQKALPYFSTVRELDQSAFSDKAEWYVALSFLHLEELEKLDSLSTAATGKFADKIREINSQLQQK